MNYATTFLRTLAVRCKVQTLSMSSAVHENVKVSGHNAHWHHVYVQRRYIAFNPIVYTCDQNVLLRLSGLIRVVDVFHAELCTITESPIVLISCEQFYMVMTRNV